MTETQTPVDEGFLRDFKDLQRKVLDISNAAGTGIQLSPGDLVASAADTRNGCLLCDGGAYDRLTYAGLYAAIAERFGSGDGVSTFNVPDYRGRALVGTGTGTGLTARAVADAFGVEAVTLTAAQSGMPAHMHTIAATTGSTTPGGGTTGSAGSHNHGTSVGSQFVESGAGGNFIGTGATGNIGLMTSTDTEPAHTHSFTGAAHTHTLPDTDTVAAANASAAHSVVQPSLAANIFIKT